MSYIYFLCTLAVITPLAVFLDCWNTRRALSNESYTFDENARASDMVMLFAPFFAFLYSENFWLVSSGIAAIIAVGMLLLHAAKVYGRLNIGAELMCLNAPGVIIIVLLIYWFGFNDGAAVVDLSDSHDVASAGVETRWWSWWPYSIYVFVIAGVLASLNKEKGADGGIFFAMAAFNILPFFTGYYWLSMLFGLVAFTSFMLKLSQSWGTGAGAAVAIIYFYMMSAGLSAALYLGLRFFGFMSL